MANKFDDVIVMVDRCNGQMRHVGRDGFWMFVSDSIILLRSESIFLFLVLSPSLFFRVVLSFLTPEVFRNILCEVLCLLVRRLLKVFDIRLLYADQMQQCSRGSDSGV